MKRTLSHDYFSSDEESDALLAQALDDFECQQNAFDDDDDDSLLAEALDDFDDDQLLADALDDLSSGVVPYRVDLSLPLILWPSASGAVGETWSRAKRLKPPYDSFATRAPPTILGRP